MEENWWMDGFVWKLFAIVWIILICKWLLLINGGKSINEWICLNLICRWLLLMYVGKLIKQSFFEKKQTYYDGYCNRWHKKSYLLWRVLEYLS